MLLQGWAPGTPEGLGFWATYALVDTALLVLFVFAVIEVITLPAWRRGLGSKWPSMVLDLAVSLGIFIGLPLLFGRAWDFWLIILPDIAGTLRNSALILLAVSTVKALSACYGASERNHAPIARHAG